MSAFDRQGTKASMCLYVEARMDLLAKNGTKQSEAERQATQNFREKKKKKDVFPARLELATFRVLGGRDNHYTTETSVAQLVEINVFKTLNIALSPARARN